MLPRFAVAQLIEQIVDGLAGVRADAGFDERDRGRRSLGFLYCQDHRQVGEPLADQHLQSAHVGQIESEPAYADCRCSRPGSTSSDYLP